jgi:hypothetical protein
MNYLTEVLKEKFPKKIDPHFRIPYIIDHKEFDERKFKKNPEIAVTILSPKKFKGIQKAQIKQELNFNNLN